MLYQRKWDIETWELNSLGLMWVPTPNFLLETLCSLSDRNLVHSDSFNTTTYPSFPFSTEKHDMAHSLFYFHKDRWRFQFELLGTRHGNDSYNLFWGGRGHQDTSAQRDRIWHSQTTNVRHTTSAAKVSKTTVNTSLHFSPRFSSDFTTD